MKFSFSRKRLVKAAMILVIMAVFICVGWTGAKLAKSGNAGIWAGAYFKDLFSGRYARSGETTDLFFLICDHWEPGSSEKNVAAAHKWLDRYESIVDSHLDSNGRRFQYTWYYPIDNMSEPVLGRLARSVFDGYGEIEVHWHHYHDTPEAFENDLQAGLEVFKRFGALVSEPGGEARWSFIHGNWALDNSIYGKCGVDNEIEIMQRHGCYADFTFPAVGMEGQPSTINRIYYVQDTPEPKSYDKGIEAEVGIPGGDFMIFHGPLALDFRDPLILIENGAIDDAKGTGFAGRLRPPTDYRGYFSPSRLPLWNEVHVSVEGMPEWVFVKTHAHGMQNTEEILGGQLDHMLGAIEKYCRDEGIKLHYVTAREAYNVVRALENGLEGDPVEFYDYEIPPPLNRRASF